MSVDHKYIRFHHMIGDPLWRWFAYSETGIPTANFVALRNVTDRGLAHEATSPT